MARIDYATQTDKDISVTFSDMPKDPALVFVSTTTGKQTPSKSTILKDGGTGSGNVPIEPSLFGASCLRVQTRDAQPQFIAQTVVFYIHAPAAARTGLKSAKRKKKKSKR